IARACYLTPPLKHAVQEDALIELLRQGPTHVQQATNPGLLGIYAHPPVNSPQAAPSVRATTEPGSRSEDGRRSRCPLASRPPLLRRSAPAILPTPIRRSRLGNDVLY